MPEFFWYLMNGSFAPEADLASITAPFKSYTGGDQSSLTPLDPENANTNNSLHIAQTISTDNQIRINIIGKYLHILRAVLASLHSRRMALKYKTPGAFSMRDFLMHKPWTFFTSAPVYAGIVSFALSFPASAALIGVD